MTKEAPLNSEVRLSGSDMIVYHSGGPVTEEQFQAREEVSGIYCGGKRPHYQLRLSPSGGPYESFFIDQLLTMSDDKYAALAKKVEEQWGSCGYVIIID